jgi:3D (Asp-Asp-Asp) domain-containing protein
MWVGVFSMASLGKFLQAISNQIEISHVEIVQKEMENHDDLLNFIATQSRLIVIDKESFTVVNHLVKDAMECVTEFKNEYIEPDKYELISVDASAYTADEDGYTSIAASGMVVREGVIALSKDLLKRWEFGTNIVLVRKEEDGKYLVLGKYKVEDMMNKRYKNACDVFMTDKEKVEMFGRRNLFLAVER